MSQSSSPTFAPLCRKAQARFTDTVDLPTPPLPLATAMMRLTPGTFCGLGNPAPGGPEAAEAQETLPPPVPLSVGALAGLYPAIRAARIPPAEAVRR